MGPTSNGCPSDDVLLAFSLGRLTDAALEPLGVHLEACPACDQRLTALEGHSDEVIHGLQRRRPAGVEFQPGELVGEYEIVGLIGSGGMARVWQARHRRQRAIQRPLPARTRFHSGPHCDFQRSQ